MNDSQLIEAALAGNQGAFAELVGAHRRPLHAHCYRMLGSLQDAEDAAQETLLRAWRNLSSFEGRSSLRSWLYSIATNVCLRTIERRPSRVLPIDYGPSADPHEPLREPLLESVWIEPYPDGQLGLEGLAGPDAHYEQRESIELAFVAALQLLPPRQRAVLILRDVLGFSGAEVAHALETTPASVYSALQRAHATLEERAPERTQQATLRALDDEQLKAIVASYVDAWARNDVEKLVGMLTDTATLAMPPIPSWYRGREAIATVLRDVVFVATRSWRMVPTTANGQLALGAYELNESGVYAPHGVTVLTLSGGLIDEITHFRTPAMVERFSLPAQG
jgi:RNA polymerase sigma-70 factor (ECF subfamily)